MVTGVAVCFGFWPVWLRYVHFKTLGPPVDPIPFFVPFRYGVHLPPHPIERL